MKFVKFYTIEEVNYDGSGCSQCSCKQFVMSNEPQFCDNCGHSRSSHYGT